MIRILVIAGLVLVLIAIIIGILSGLGNRLQWWSFGTGFIILKWAIYGALAAFLVSALGLYMTRPGSGQAGFVWALLTCVLSVSMISVPALWMYRARQLPRIHDITTDTVVPPQFIAVLPLRQDSDNSTDYAGLDIAIQQQKAYPDITSVLSKQSPAQTYAHALTVARLLGWEIIAADADGLRIEATDTTFWFGYKDDIVIRILPMDGGNRMDLRSVSRVGVSDVGTNARRIRVFLHEIHKLM